MKLRFSEGAWKSLDNAINFYLLELEIPEYIVDKIVAELFKKIENLVKTLFWVRRNHSYLTWVKIIGAFFT